MSYFSESSYCSVEEHIGNLEDLYAEGFQRNVDQHTLIDLHQLIKKLEKKVRDRNNFSRINVKTGKVNQAFITDQCLARAIIYDF